MEAAEPQKAGGPGIALPASRPEPTPSAPQASTVSPAVTQTQEILAELTPLAPTEAARWLFGRTSADMVVMLARAEAGALPASVRVAFAALGSEYVPIGEWLAGRGPWLVETAGLLRLLLDGQPLPVAEPAAVAPTPPSAPVEFVLADMVASLTPLSSEQAAAWLVANLDLDMLGQLAAIPAGQEAIYLRMAPLMRPDLAELACWLQQRPEWTAETLAYLRARTAPVPARAAKAG